MRNLVGGQQLCMICGETEFLGDVGSYSLTITREHDGIFHAKLPELSYRFGALWFNLVVDDDVTGIFAIDGYVNNGTRVGAGTPLGTCCFHEFRVTNAHDVARLFVGTLHQCPNALAGNFLNMAHGTTIGGLVGEGVAQSRTDRVG